MLPEPSCTAFADASNRGVSHYVGEVEVAFESWSLQMQQVLMHMPNKVQLDLRSDSDALTTKQHFNQSASLL
ncbi:TPA: hypothetical protein ACH3X1_005269 [Trebouxia sp. C0004]